LLDQRSTWAITCHKVAENFDTGDILAAQEFKLASDECHESLDIKSQLAGKQLAIAVANNIENLWNAATPQGAGNYVKLWTDANREIDFNASAGDIALQLRAFGNFECIATLNGMRYFIRRAISWVEEHPLAPGTLAHIDGLHYVIACKDGYVTLLDWSLIPPGMKIYATFR
jgi:methionyl-tRNA formyltransferase